MATTQVHFTLCLLQAEGYLSLSCVHPYHIYSNYCIYTSQTLTFNHPQLIMVHF